MYAGRIVEDAPVKKLFDNPHHPYTIGLLESLPCLDQTAETELTAIPGQLSNAPSVTGTTDMEALQDVTPLRGDFHEAQFGGSIPQAIRAAGGTYWGLFVGDVTVEDIVEAQALGLRLDLWGVTDEAAMQNALQLNGDAVTVSRPDILQRLRHRHWIQQQHTM